MFTSDSINYTFHEKIQSGRAIIGAGDNNSAGVSRRRDRPLEGGTQYFSSYIIIHNNNNKCDFFHFFSSLLVDKIRPHFNFFVKYFLHFSSLSLKLYNFRSLKKKVHFALNGSNLLSYRSRSIIDHFLLIVPLTNVATNQQPPPPREKTKISVQKRSKQN